MTLLMLSQLPWTNTCKVHHPTAFRYNATWFFDSAQRRDKNSSPQQHRWHSTSTRHADDATVLIIGDTVTSQHCLFAVLFEAGTPTQRTNTNELAPDVHETWRHDVPNVSTSGRMVQWDMHIFIFVLFYFILSIIRLYAHIVCTESREANLWTFTTTSTRSYTKGRWHTPVLIHLPAPTRIHASHTSHDCLEPHTVTSFTTHHSILLSLILLC